MKEIFTDTNAWVALKHKGDSSWQTATDLNQTLLSQGVHYVTSNFVLDEAYTLLLIRVGHHVAVELGEEVRASRLLTVVHISEELEEEAWALFRRYSDKEFSFTDCTSFVVMRRRGIQEAFTNDHHFEQAGYQALLK
jgi:uncharacterized protein